jgi:hypothetical protein
LIRGDAALHCPEGSSEASGYLSEGWIEFENGEAGSTKGDVVLETRGLIKGTV